MSLPGRKEHRTCPEEGGHFIGQESVEKDTWPIAPRCHLGVMPEYLERVPKPVMHSGPPNHSVFADGFNSCMDHFPSSAVELNKKSAYAEAQRQGHIFLNTG